MSTQFLPSDTRLAILAFVLTTMLGCGGQTPAAPREESLGLVADWVRAGSFQYQGAECAFVGSDNVFRSFACGELLLGLTASLTADDIRDLLAAISGEVIQDVDPRLPHARITVRVPVQSEREAILQALTDERIRYVNLNWTDGVLRNTIR